MRKKLALFLSGFLLATGLMCGQALETTNVRHGSTLPPTCNPGDVFVKSGVLYYNNSTSAGTCSWVSAAVASPTPIASGGTNATSASAALVNLFPAGTEVGDMPY
jgi:hypothetical protein